MNSNTNGGVTQWVDEWAETRDDATSTTTAMNIGYVVTTDYGVSVGQ